MVSAFGVYRISPPTASSVAFRPSHVLRCTDLSLFRMTDGSYFVFEDDGPSSALSPTRPPPPGSPFSGTAPYPVLPRGCRRHGEK
jgi:hypothetical protein